MSRYSILLKKNLEEIKQAGINFGFEFEMDKSGERKKHFNLMPGATAAVGIVYDDPGSLFYGSKVHFFKSHRFFCKSVGNRPACCCQMGYSGRNAVFRIATIIASYSLGEDTLRICDECGRIGLLCECTTMHPYSVFPQVLPWVFGEVVYNRLQFLHQSKSVALHDLFIKKLTDKYQPYDIHQASISVWQQSTVKPRILEIHSHLKRHIRDYLANDYTEDRIREVINGQM
jgi:hypothetical protein